MMHGTVVMTAPELAPEAVTLLADAGLAIVYMRPFPSAGEVADVVRKHQAVAVICRQGRVNGAVMDASAGLKIIARHGVGMDEVDLDAARARGLLVCRAPGSNSVAVAEHTIALVLALAKDILPLAASVAQGGWRAPGAQLRDIAGLRLGLVGFGPIGQRVARMAMALGMEVAATHPSGTEQGAGAASRDPDHVPRLTFDGLLARSDVVSLHCPLLPHTQGMIDARALGLLPPGALLVNTARGGLLDEVAVTRALDSGQLGGAALDVFIDEPPAPDHPLRRHRRVICTPHVAGVTASSMRAMGMMAAQCVIAALAGAAIPPERVVVPAGIA